MGLVFVFTRESWGLSLRVLSEGRGFSSTQSYPGGVPILVRELTLFMYSIWSLKAGIEKCSVDSNLDCEGLCLRFVVAGHAGVM